jgi:hypothetical protein
MKIIILVLLALPLISQANTYFEPYLGFGIGTLEQNFTKISGKLNGTTINLPDLKAKGEDAGGANIGLRLYGKAFDQFFLGGDVNIGIKKVTINYYDSAEITSYGTDKFKFVTTSYGIIAGWDIPTILFPRIWGGFYIDGLGLTEEGSSHTDSYSGTSVKFGFSFDWWVQLGFEMAKHSYTKVNGDKLPISYTQSGITLTAQKVTFNEFILTLSYPFDITNK